MIEQPPLQSNNFPKQMLIQATLTLVHHSCLLSPIALNKPTIPKKAPMAIQFCPKNTATARDLLCSARRRVRYNDDDDEDEDEDYGHNMDIAMLESYTESARSVVLLVRAMVDEEQEEVLIFKGFSSCLSARTASDPSKSVLPAKAVIQSIDVIKGPFDPTNVEYLEKDLSLEVFKARFQTNR